MKITVTEALGKISLIDKQIDAELAAVAPYIAYTDNLKDPLEKDGGSKNFVKSRVQSVDDMLKNKNRLRVAINTANLSNKVTVAEETRSVAEWLIWRRECLPKQKHVVNQLLQAANNLRSRVNTSNQQHNQSVGVVSNLDEKKLNEEVLKIQSIENNLDTQLSLFNATTLVEV